MNSAVSARPWLGDFVLLAAIWGASFMFMRVGAADLGADISTTGTQTYAGPVTLSGATRTLTTTNSTVTFSSTVDSEAGQNRGLTLALGSGQVKFDDGVGGIDQGTVPVEHDQVIASGHRPAAFR